METFHNSCFNHSGSSVREVQGIFSDMDIKNASFIAIIQFLEQQIKIDFETYKRLSIFLSAPVRQKITLETCRIMKTPNPYENLKQFYTELKEFFDNFKIIPPGVYSGSIFIKTYHWQVKSNYPLGGMNICGYNAYSPKELQALLFVLAAIDPSDKIIKHPGKNILAAEYNQLPLKELGITNESTLYVKKAWA